MCWLQDLVDHQCVRSVCTLWLYLFADLMDVVGVQSTALVALSPTCWGRRIYRRLVNSSTRTSTSCGLVTRSRSLSTLFCWVIVMLIVLDHQKCYITTCDLSALQCSHFRSSNSSELLVYVAPIKISWRYLKRFKSYHVDKTKTRGQSSLTKSALRGAQSPVRGHPRGSKFVPLNSWGRGSY